MGPTYIVVARHRDGSVTITKYTREDEAREAFDLVSKMSTADSCYMAGVVREMHVRNPDAARPLSAELTLERIDASTACAQCKGNAKTNLAGGYRHLAWECLDYCARGHVGEVAQLRHALATLPAEIGAAVAQAIVDATPTLTAELPPPSAMPTTDDDGLEF